MIYTVENREDNISTSLKEKGVTNSNVISSIQFKTLASNIAIIYVNFNPKFPELKTSIDIKNCDFYSLKGYEKDTKTGKAYYSYLTLLSLEFNRDGNQLSKDSIQENTFFVIRLLPETNTEKEFLPNKFKVIGWYWANYQVSIILQKVQKRK